MVYYPFHYNAGVISKNLVEWIYKMQSQPGKHIVIVGSTGSGKTTLAMELAYRLGIVHIELDALYWLPNWTPRSKDETRRIVADTISDKEWVTDGNYRFCRDIVWKCADTIIWLDYGFFITFQRLLIRTLKRCWNRELLWGTNRENLLDHMKFWSDDSLFNWLIKTHWSRKKEYQNLLSSPKFSHLTIVHLASPRETNNWLNNLIR